MDDKTIIVGKSYLFIDSVSSSSRTMKTSVSKRFHQQTIRNNNKQGGTREGEGIGNGIIKMNVRRRIATSEGGWVSIRFETIEDGTMDDPPHGIIHHRPPFIWKCSIPGSTTT